MSPTLFTWYVESLLSIYSLLYCWLVYWIGENFVISKDLMGFLLLLMMMYLLLYEPSIHFAQKYTNCIFIAYIFSFFTLLRLLTDYLILSNCGWCNYCFNIEQNNVEFLPRNLGFKTSLYPQYCNEWFFKIQLPLYPLFLSQWLIRTFKINSLCKKDFYYLAPINLPS